MILILKKIQGKIFKIEINQKIHLCNINLICIMHLIQFFKNLVNMNFLLEIPMKLILCLKLDHYQKHMDLEI